MQYTVSRFAVFIGMIWLLAACGGQPGAAPANSGGSGSAPAAPSNTITAVKVDAVAADAAAAYWADAPAVMVHTKATEKDKPDGPDVTIQAVYDDQNVAVRLEWADPTETILANPWTWDGSAWKRGGDPMTAHEDRMSIIFPIENNPDFSSKGCAGACHNLDADPEKWWMGTDSADQHLDLWEWKAAQTNPLGLTDDYLASVQEDPADIESATHPDANTGGGNVSNVNQAKDGPAFMNGADVTASFIITGQQAEIDTSKLAPGAIIPANILRPWTGSRADVQASGVWKDGKWTVVLMRALDTGHEDDVVFSPPKAYPLGVALFDHLDLREHTITPDVLTLTWK